MKKAAKKTIKKVKPSVKKLVDKKTVTRKTSLKKPVASKTISSVRKRPQPERPPSEVAEIKVLDRIDAELAKKPSSAKPAKAVNRKGTVVIEADQDQDTSKPGKSVVMTGDGPKSVDDNGEVE